MVHGLAGGELGHGGQDTVGVARQEDGVGRVASLGAGLVVGDVVDRVGNTAVLRLVLVEVVGDLRVESDANANKYGIQSIGMHLNAKRTGLEARRRAPSCEQYMTEARIELAKNVGIEK